MFPSNITTNGFTATQLFDSRLMREAAIYTIITGYNTPENWCVSGAGEGAESWEEIRKFSLVRVALLTEAGRKIIDDVWVVLYGVDSVALWYAQWKLDAVLRNWTYKQSDPLTAFIIEFVSLLFLFCVSTPEAKILNIFRPHLVELNIINKRLSTITVEPKYFTYKQFFISTNKVHRIFRIVIIIHDKGFLL